MTSRWTLLFGLALSGLALSGCAAMGSAEPGDDSDADGDADTDADTDADADNADGGVRQGESTDLDCSDGEDNDDNQLVDCADPTCASQAVCCEEAATPLLSDGFDGALDLERWKPFGDPPVSLSDSVLRPSGDESFENGLVSLESFNLSGAMRLTGTLRAPATCEGCQELIGMALTDSNDYGTNATVNPVAAAVLDLATGELLAVVQGVVEARIALPEADIQVFSLLVHPDRHVTFLDGSNQPLFTSTFTIDASLRDPYVALYGRGGQSAGFEEVRLEATVCSLPSAGRRSETPVLSASAAPFATNTVRAPSVALAPDGVLEALFTGANGGGSSIGRAISADEGRSFTWEPAETAVITNADLPFGYQDADDASLLFLPEGGRVAAVSAAQVGDASARAISILVSEDGLDWELGAGEQPLALPELCRSARDPELQLTGSGPFVMLFTCEDVDGGGRTSISRATSEDGLTWGQSGGALLVSDGRAGELDGLAAPALRVAPVGGLQELWFEARDGTLRTILFAASADGYSWTRWDGEVLGPGAAGAWDELAVGSPSVAVTDAHELLLFYTGQGALGQAIGRVDRQLPVF